MKAFYSLVVSIALLVTLGSPVFAQVTNPADPGVKRPSALDPKRPLNAELRTSVGEGFTLTAVGDLIMSRPLSQYAAREPRVKSVLDILTSGDHCNSVPNSLTIFTQNFRLANSFRYDYTMDPEDQADIYQSIREGKQNADFLVATIHSHDCSLDCDDPDKPQLAAAYLRTMAHKAIDSGADEFVTTGIHNLGPIEIYKGRPIFYGISNFFWSDIQLPLSHDLLQQNRTILNDAYIHPERATSWDLSAPLNAQGGFAEPFVFQTIITQATFSHGELAKLKLYAGDLGYGMKLSESGIPRLADPAFAKKIFKRIADATAQYGLPALKMTIDGSEATIEP